MSLWHCPVQFPSWHLLSVKWHCLRQWSLSFPECLVLKGRDPASAILSSHWELCPAHRGCSVLAEQASSRCPHWEGTRWSPEEAALPVIHAFESHTCLKHHVMSCADSASAFSLEYRHLSLQKLIRISQYFGKVVLRFSCYTALENLISLLR